MKKLFLLLLLVLSSCSITKQKQIVTDIKYYEINEKNPIVLIKTKYNNFYIYKYVKCIEGQEISVVIKNNINTYLIINKKKYKIIEK